jgi:phosphoglycolate phosphatase-like HAD superfamily hydrolase
MAASGIFLGFLQLKTGFGEGAFARQLTDRRKRSRFFMVKTLLLWDIDGTLIASGGAGMRALRTALFRVFGIDGSLDDIDFAGRTDRWIIRQVFAKFALPATEENFERYFEGYVAELPAALANPAARVLPGVSAVLQAVATHGAIAQGLLTGNMRRGAQTKLQYHGLWDYFAFGAFADDSELRNDLGPHALRRAAAHAGIEFLPERVWIIGDTPHDVACGKAIGARTLAVATGGHSLAALREHTPTELVADLTDTAALLRLFS